MIVTGPISMRLVSHEPDNFGDWGGRVVSKLEGLTCLSVSPSRTDNGRRGVAPATVTFWVPSAFASPQLPAGLHASAINTQDHAETDMRDAHQGLRACSLQPYV